MSSEACALRFSSRDFTNAAASSGVKNSLPANCAGRSSGVYVAKVQLPVRSGAPSLVRGTLYACLAEAAEGCEGGAGLAAGDCATSGSDPRDTAAMAAINARFELI